MCFHEKFFNINKMVKLLQRTIDLFPYMFGIILDEVSSQIIRF